MHVSSSVHCCARAFRPLAAPLRALRRVPEPGAWLRLAGAATGEQAAAFCVVLFHGLPDLLLGTGPEVLCHG